MRQDEEAKHIFFTADLHLLHPKIVDICNRPTTINEHDEWVIDRINSVVGKKDELYILGDVSMASKEKTDKLLQKIHGDKKLIIFIHGGLNTPEDSLSKSKIIIENMRNKEDFYPLFVSWDSGLLSTYWDHLW